MNELAKQVAGRIEEARQAEAADHTAAAIKLYEENIKSGYADQYSFDRLMILYRKEKKYKDELRVIKRGIKVFTEDLERRQKGQIGSAKNKKQVTELSNAIMKSAGLRDRKGNSTYLPEPLAKWTKRKEVVEKKLE